MTTQKLFCKVYYHFRQVQMDTWYTDDCIFYSLVLQREKKLYTDIICAKYFGPQAK
jgi:hypothetical protein